MRTKLIFLIISTFGIISSYAGSQKSPHGAGLKINCAVCHTTEGWAKIRPEGFNHKKTRFPLTGQHKMIDCKQCHTSLKFTETKTECVNCHNDIHQGTTDKDCSRCHNTNSWIVNNIRQIHQQNGFPLLGSHASADCNRCHSSASKLRFDNIRSDCYACHRQDYEATTNPNHKLGQFSTDCSTCHNLSGQNWFGKGFTHSFFPLNGGHNIDCGSCHKSGYKGLSTECVSCHLANYNATTNPSHLASNFSKDCKTCHTITAWRPASFNHDKQYFPIYSGKHRGAWSNCNECHSNPSNYSSFSCTNCHEHNKSSMDQKHREERGYVYNSTNCYSCHPRGSAD